MKSVKKQYELDDNLKNEVLIAALEDEIDLDDEVEEDTDKSSLRTKSLFKRLTENVKIETLIVLLVTLIMNTYAWFIFVRTAYVNVTTHIQSWNFEFDDEDTTVRLDVDKIYPGMVPVYKTITGTNRGEMSAVLTSELAYVKILDRYEFLTDMSLKKNEEFLANNTFTSKLEEITPEELKEKMEELPFRVEIYAYKPSDQLSFEGCDKWTDSDWDSLSSYLMDDSTETIMETDQSEIITIVLRWPYETKINGSIELGDAIDTEWGEASYDYMQNNSEEPCVKMTVRFVAKQKAT